MYKRDNTSHRKPSKYIDNTRYNYEGKPKGDNKVDNLISVRSLKDLPKSSYALKADPYEAGLSTSEPYNILNKFNKTVGGTYVGEQNIDGGNVQQYANSTTSIFNKAFDEFRTIIKVNYRFLPINRSGVNYPGYQLIEEMRKSIAESVSLLNSTTYTNMAINQFAVETDLNMGSAQTNNIANGNTPINAYTNLTDVLYAMSVYYQTFLQESLSVMNWHNSFRLKQGTAIRNAWNREVPNLNSFFGLMNKKAFLSLLESINLSYEGEYVDKDFMKQMNMLTLIPSRRSNAMTDPVLELQLQFNHPTKFKVYVIGSNGKIIDTDDTPLFDDSNLKLNILDDGTNKDVTFWDACSKLKNYLSLEATQLWARSNYTPGRVTETDNARYNQIKAYFDVIINSFTYFKPLWSDYRESLDVMVRTGTINWTKGFRPGITQSTDTMLFWNLLVDHIYQLIYSGPRAIDYDNATKRWRTFSLWNMYSGIPEYDKFSGGAFLSFSFKDYSNFSSNEQIEYLPILFDVEENPVCVACSRDGKEAVISLASIKFSDAANGSVELLRLAPLASQSELSIRLPQLGYANNHLTSNPVHNLTAGHIAMIVKSLTQIFQMCTYQVTSSATNYYSIDPDVLAIYQIEINDITNQAITYARAYAPFKGTTSDIQTLGFHSISRE